MDLGEGEKPEEAGRMGGGEKREKERRQRWSEGERNEETGRKYRGTEMSFGERDKKQQAGETERAIHCHWNGSNS